MTSLTNYSVMPPRAALLPCRHRSRCEATGCPCDPIEEAILVASGEYCRDTLAVFRLELVAEYCPDLAAEFCLDLAAEYCHDIACWCQADVNAARSATVECPRDATKWWCRRRSGGVA